MRPPPRSDDACDTWQAALGLPGRRRPAGPCRTGFSPAGQQSQQDEQHTHDGQADNGGQSVLQEIGRGGIDLVELHGRDVDVLSSVTVSKLRVSSHATNANLSVEAMPGGAFRSNREA